MHMPAPESFTRHETCPVLDRPLSDLERRVVRLGRADAERGERPARFPRLSGFVARLTGNGGAQPLAEQGLETLRRFASAVRRGDHAAARLSDELRALGFSADALGTAVALARR